MFKILFLLFVSTLMYVYFQTMVSSLSRWKIYCLQWYWWQSGTNTSTAIRSSSSSISILCSETHCCFHFHCQVSTQEVVIERVIIKWQNFTIKNTLNSHCLPHVGFTRSKRKWDHLYLYFKNDSFLFWVWPF